MAKTKFHSSESSELIVFKSFQNTLTKQEFARVPTITLVKLGIADQGSEVRQHLSFNASLWQIFTWKKTYLS